MDSVLITGGAGFIGSHLVDALIEGGYDVHVIDDLSTGKEVNINPNCKFYRLKIQDREVENIFKKTHLSYVFHLAAQADVRKSCSDPLYDAESNIMGTINILSLSKNYHIEKFIFSSSGGVIYGNVRKPARENFKAKPISPYGISKLTGEHYIKFFGEYYPYTILRYSNVYGERQDPFGEAGVVAIFTQKMLNGEQCTLYGHGRPKRDYVYIKDVVNANILSIEKGDNETLNIGTGKATEVEDLYYTLKKITGSDIKPIYKSLREGELVSNCLCIEKAKETLGWEPSVTLKQGLSEVVEWFMANS